MTEIERNELFKKDTPLILGDIFRIICKAMSIIPSVRIDLTPRFADFQKWGYALAESLSEGSGDRFLKLYRKNDDYIQNMKTENNALVIAIIEFMKDKESWESNMSTLYGELQSIVTRLHLDTHTDSWPGGANILSRRLKKYRYLLKRNGIIVIEKTTTRSSHLRPWELRRIPIDDYDT